jgi:DsbC/DsbD-like thiol-disulfide interchange protein
MKALIALSILAISTVVIAQSNVPPSVKLLLPASAKHGAAVAGTVQVSFGGGLHAYQNPPSDPDLIPVSVTITSKGVKLKTVKYPAGKDMSVGGDPKKVKVYSGSVNIPVSLILGPKRGKLSLEIDFHYQQCNSSSCYPPSDVKATASILVK